MARKIQIEVDTTLNYCRVTDADTTTGDINHEFYGVLGWGFGIMRPESSTALTNANALIKLTTPTGETGYFKIADVDYFKLDGINQVQANLSVLISNISPYIFAA